MIGIEIIKSTNIETFGERLELFLNSHPDAKVLYASIRGVEGGKGLVMVLSYGKKEAPEPEPVVVPKITAAQKKIDAEAEAKADKKAKLEKQLAELGE